MTETYIAGQRVILVGDPNVMSEEERGAIAGMIVFICHGLHPFSVNATFSLLAGVLGTTLLDVNDPVPVWEMMKSVIDKHLSEHARSSCEGEG